MIFCPKCTVQIIFVWTAKQHMLSQFCVTDGYPRPQSAVHYDLIHLKLCFLISPAKYSKKPDTEVFNGEDRRTFSNLVIT